MNKEIKDDIFKEKYLNKINSIVNDIIIKNPKLVEEYPILEIEFNVDGSKKDICNLASERDIKIMQIKSDKSEQDFKFSQNKISKDEYEINIDKINKKIRDLDLLYDDLIFDIINSAEVKDIEESILKYNLSDIDLSRLADAINSVSENKIEEFRKNNKEFMIDKLSYWNYKYDKISKGISKARDIERFILNIIEK